MDRSFYFILFYFISFYFYFISYSFFFSILFHKRISSCPFSARAIFFSSRRIKIVIDFFFSFSLFKKPPKIEKKIKNRKKGNIFFFRLQIHFECRFFFNFLVLFSSFPIFIFGVSCFLITKNENEDDGQGIRKSSPYLMGSLSFRLCLI